ncbi:MAG: SpoIIE family protein phosphatase [Pseudomonadota bacterium]
MSEFIDNNKIVEQLEKKLKGKEAELDELYGVLNRLNSYVANLIQDAEAGVRAAITLHRKLATRKLPKLSDVNFSSKYIISNTELSSYYEFFELPDASGGGVLVCDSKGYGISALMMSVVISLLETAAAKSPRTFVETLRADIKEHIKKDEGKTLNTNGKTASIFYMVFERGEMNLRYCSVGMPGFLVVRGNEVTHLGENNADIINVQDAEEKNIKLTPGDRIIIPNRGITFSQNAFGDKFGIERLKNCLMNSSHIPIADVVSNIGYELDNFTQNQRSRLCGDMVVVGMELARKMLYVV